MQLSAIILSFFLSTGFLSSDERAYDRLQKKYDRNPDKCELIARRMIERNRSRPEPYFFISLVYYDRYKNEKSVRDKYKDMSQSLIYGRKLLRLKTSSEMVNFHRWEGLRANLEREVPILINQLNEAGMDSKADNLYSKANRMKLVEPRVIPKPKKVLVEINGFRNGQYFGLPTGSEEVQSASISKEKELLRILNVARKEKGMKPLVWDEDLARAARYHSYDMATQNYFDHSSHDRIDGDLLEVGNAFSRIRKFYTKGFVNSENIAAGRGSSKGTYMQWYNSPGHYRNMFNSTSTKVGIGLYYLEGSTYGYYWSFCTSRD
ncbi:MAG: CAP domain-containing protein [Bacteroidia bacterium]